MNNIKSPYDLSYKQSIAFIIRNLGVMNQYLLWHSLQKGFLSQARELKQLDNYLIWLLKNNRESLDFLGRISNGRILLVGEGNLSFSLSLVKLQSRIAGNITASTFESAQDLSQNAKENASKLKQLGVRVLHKVDATDLSAHFRTERFDTIVFQFPNVASRDSVEGHNPNFILVRDFLLSAKQQLSQGGQVLISAVDSPYYQGAFQLDKAADEAGFSSPTSYSFDPLDFPGYDHTMTHQSGSAIEQYDTFVTWVFVPK